MTELAEPTALPVLLALNRLGKPMYMGTVPADEVARRRARSKAARVSRRKNRRLANVIHAIARFVAALLAEIEAERSNITTGPAAGSPVCLADRAEPREVSFGFAAAECRQG